MSSGKESPSTPRSRRTYSAGSRLARSLFDDNNNASAPGSPELGDRTNSTTHIEAEPTASSRPPAAPGTPNSQRRNFNPFRSPKNQSSPGSNSPGRSPPPTLSASAMRPRAWTGPSLPPFHTTTSLRQIETERLQRSLSTSNGMLRQPTTTTMLPTLSSENILNRDDNESTGDIPNDPDPELDSRFGPLSRRPSMQDRKASVRSEEGQPGSPTSPTSPIHHRLLNLPRPNLRRASSPSIVPTTILTGSIQSVDKISGAITPRRASIDSAFRSTDEIALQPGEVQLGRSKSQVHRNNTETAATASAPWTPTPKRKMPSRLAGESVRVSLQNLASLSTKQAAKLPATLASTTAMLKDKTIRHIRSPSGSTKYDSSAVVDILDVPPKEIARQLALMDSEFFRAIPREELASVAWTGAEKYNRAPVIVATTQHFNQVTLWVSEEIVTSKDLKRRFQLLCHFIGVAKASLDLSNYNGVRSITAGLQSAPVHRLERTWAMVGRREKAAFDKMCDLMSPLRNSDAYRRRLIDTKPPCVPYLGTWLSDLTFLFECYKKEKDDPNRAQQAIDRQAQMDALLDDVARYQAGSVYNFEPSPVVQEIVLSVKFHPDYRNWIEEDHYRKSCQVERKGGAAGAAAADGNGGGNNSGSASGGMANGTFKGVKNRLRGSSLGNKYEPVARSLVDLDGGSPILERKTAGGIGSSSSHSSSRDVSGLSIHNIGSSQQLSRRAFSIELSDQGLVDSPQGSADISVEQKEKQDASPNLQVSSRLRRQRSIGAPLSRFANARGGGHRRTKSGSAVVMYGRSTGNIGATMDDDSDDSGVPSRTSLDSLSDCLDSKGWDEMEEKDRNLQQPNADPISFRTRQPSLKMGSYDGGNVVHRGLFAVEGYKNRAATLGSPRAPIPSSLPVTESACSSSLEFTPAPPLTHKPSAHVIDAPIEVHLLEAPPRQMTLLSTDSDSDADIFVVSEYPDSRRQTGYSAPASDQSLMSGPPSPSVTAPPGTQSARADNNRPLAMDIDSLTGMGGISALPSHAVTAIRITPPSPATPISLQMGESGHAPFIDPLEKRNIGGGGGDIDAALQIVSTISPGTPPTRSRATSFSAATSALFKNAPGILRTTTNSNTLPAVSSHIPPHSTSFSQPSSPHPTPPPAPSSKQPHFQGVLWKKDELNEKGMRAINRKWAQVWAVLYAEPPQLEFYRLGGKGGISDSRAAAAAAAAISASGDVEKSGNPIMFDPVTGQLIPGGRSSSIPTNSSSANNGESYESIRSKTWGARPSVGQRPLANTESTSIHGSDASTYIPASSQAASVTSIRSNNPDSEAPTTNPGAPTSSSNPLSKQASSRKGIWHSIATFGHGASSGSAIFGAAPQAPVTTPGGTWTAGSRSRSSSNAGRGGRTTNERPIGMGTNTSGSGSNTISNGNAYQSHESSGSGGLHSTDNDRPPSQVIPLSRPKAAALPATGYTKHKHVLRLYPVARRTILLRCPSEADKERWSRMIAEVAAMPGANSSLVDGLDMTSPEGSRTGTLVSPSLGFTPMTTIETLDRAKKSAGSIASVPQDGVMRSTRDLHQST